MFLYIKLFFLLGYPINSILNICNESNKISKNKHEEKRNKKKKWIWVVFSYAFPRPWTMVVMSCHTYITFHTVGHVHAV